MRQINPNGYQSLCHSIYDNNFVVIKSFNFDFQTHLPLLLCKSRLELSSIIFTARVSDYIRLVNELITFSAMILKMGHKLAMCFVGPRLQMICIVRLQYYVHEHHRKNQRLSWQVQIIIWESASLGSPAIYQHSWRRKIICIICIY